MTRTLKKAWGVLLIALTISPAVADEGMWLLPYLKTQNYAKMKKMGLNLTPEQIYNPTPNGAGSLTDAVVRFGRGCTGEIVSAQGLLFTNHHCGFDQIREHSSVDNNLLKNGFYAATLSAELPNPGLTVTFTEEIVNVTDYVAAYLKKHNTTDPMEYLSRKYLSKIADEWYRENRGERPKGITLDLAPFYEGNRYWLFVQKVYSDVRLVAAPPLCVGSYGSDTDNWVWPRHSGDFSVFRVYTAPNGEPAEYSPNNIPLRSKHYLKLNAHGVQEGDFAMIIGFPGTTNHFYTASEVAERRDIDNSVRIEMREVRQKNMLEEMRRDEKINIQYASKYNGSTNAYKNAIGSNWAINKMDFEATQRQLQERLISYARQHGKPEYRAAIVAIEEIVSKRASERRRLKMIDEGLMRAVESMKMPLLKESEFGQLSRDPGTLEAWLTNKYDGYFDKDYDNAVDRKVSKAMLKAYISEIPATQRPKALQALTPELVDSYVDQTMDSSAYRSKEVLRQMISRGDYNAYTQDPLVALVQSTRTELESLQKKLAEYDREFAKARHTYLQGLLEMESEQKLWPDANSTLRYTFGQIKGYSPRDNVFYGHQTTTQGVLEKEDPNNPEYQLVPKMKSILLAKDFGRLALPDGRMPVDLCATTHTTGGNSGSPLIDANGHLIGLNFDRNWEGVGGDINYLPDYQRSIICDVRYVLFILKNYLEADRLLSELNIVY